MASRLTIIIATLILVFILAQFLAYNKLSLLRNQSLRTIDVANEDIVLDLISLCRQLNVKLYLLDETILKILAKGLSPNAQAMLEIQRFLSFGLDIKDMHVFQTQIAPVLQIKDVDIFNVKNINPVETPKPLFKNKPIGIFLKKQDLVLHIFILHSREGFWWIGSVASDPYFTKEINIVGSSSENHLNQLLQERAIEKFLAQQYSLIEGLYIPQNISHFLADYRDSRFHECPNSKARSFNKKYRYITSQAFKFMHKSYKLLSRVCSVLYHLNIPFWLSSGTCLGYYRECNIIPYSSDVDIGIFSKHYTPFLVSRLQENNFTLKHKFGLMNDSLEYSFIASSIPDIKLDIFYFYGDNATVWSGATQPESRKKYKFTFPKFDLCWTEFISLKVRIPCDTQTYLKAIYGPNWNTPQEYWDWKSSPNNVEYNGMWSLELVNETIQIFR